MSRLWMNREAAAQWLAERLPELARELGDAPPMDDGARSCCCRPQYEPDDPLAEARELDELLTEGRCR